MLIDGTSGPDFRRGTDTGDTIYLGDGNDIAFARAGNDIAYGGPGSDIIGGGPGNDSIYGESGSDLIFGGAGDDSLFGNGDADIIFAGEGDDDVDGASGNDILGGGAGDDEIYGNVGNDTMFGGAGNDTAVFEGESLTFTRSSLGGVVVTHNDTGEVDRLYGFEFVQNGSKLVTIEDAINPPVLNYVITTFFGNAHPDVVGDDGFMPYGTGNLPTNFAKVLQETTSESTIDISVEIGEKAKATDGGDYIPDTVSGDPIYTVPAGILPSPGPVALEAVWSFEAYINPDANGTTGRELGNDDGDIGATRTFKLFDTASGNQVGATVTLHWFELDPAANAGDGYWGLSDGTPVLGDQEIDGFYAGSANIADIRGYIGDIEGTPGVDLYQFQGGYTLTDEIDPYLNRAGDDIPLPEGQFTTFIIEDADP